MTEIEKKIDDYLIKSAEPKQEPEALETCVNCGEEIFEGEIAVADAGGNVFCCYDCATERHSVNEVTIKGIYPEGTCKACGLDLEAEEYEVYTTAEGGFFCSEACAGNYLGIETVFIERKKEK